MSADGTAFKCYLPSDSFKEDPPMVGMDKSGAGADEWDTETRLNTYKYVRFSGSRAGPPVRANKVYVLGRKIDSQCSDIPGSIPHEGKIGYDPGSNTLTIEDAMLDVSKFDSGVSGGNLIAGIYSMSDLDLVLIGESTIFSSDDNTSAEGTDKASDRSEERKAASDKKVKTGDQNDAVIWYSICLSAAAVLVLMTIIRLCRRSARSRKNI